MTTLLLIIMIVSGLIMTFCVLMMSPKWWLWFWIGGAATSSNEYGTSKTIESKLKSIVTIAGIIFIVSAIFYPYTKPVNQAKLDAVRNIPATTSGDASPIDSLNLENTIPSSETQIPTLQAIDSDWNPIDIPAEVVIWSGQ